MAGICTDKQLWSNWWSGGGGAGGGGAGASGAEGGGGMRVLGPPCCPYNNNHQGALVSWYSYYKVKIYDGFQVIYTMYLALLTHGDFLEAHASLVPRIVLFRHVGKQAKVADSTSDVTMET